MDRIAPCTLFFFFFFLGTRLINYLCHNRPTFLVFVAGDEFSGVVNVVCFSFHLPLKYIKQLIPLPRKSITILNHILSITGERGCTGAQLYRGIEHICIPILKRPHRIQYGWDGQCKGYAFNISVMIPRRAERAFYVHSMRIVCALECA